MRVLIGVCLALLPCSSAFGQGCVCQRQNASGYAGDNAYMRAGDWLFSEVYQNFTSDRHYQGTNFISSITDRGPDNVQNAVNLSVSYAVSNRLNLSVDAPFLFTSYTLHRAPPGSPSGTAPVYDATHSSGLGDMSVRATWWARSTFQAKQNIAFSIGMQVPTGAAGLTDTIYGRVVPEDVSVQL